MTTDAVMPTVAEPPAPGMIAGRAGETARPAQALQVFQAVTISAELRLELTHGPG
jgi:hypothetical protein